MKLERAHYTSQPPGGRCSEPSGTGTLDLVELAITSTQGLAELTRSAAQGLAELARSTAQGSAELARSTAKGLRQLARSAAQGSSKLAGGATQGPAEPVGFVVQGLTELASAIQGAAELVGRGDVLADFSVELSNKLSYSLNIIYVLYDLLPNELLNPPCSLYNPPWTRTTQELALVIP